MGSGLTVSLTMTVESMFHSIDADGEFNGEADQEGTLTGFSLSPKCKYGKKNGIFPYLLLFGY